MVNALWRSGARLLSNSPEPSSLVPRRLPRPDFGKEPLCPSYPFFHRFFHLNPVEKAFHSTSPVVFHRTRARARSRARFFRFSGRCTCTASLGTGTISQPSLFRVARRLPWLQEKVCILCLPPAFAAVPQYLFHTSVVRLALSEPDKRLSHIRLLETSFREPPPYASGSGFCGLSVSASPPRLTPA